jgi:hypothetical protein
MYNREELPKPDASSVHLEDGEVIKLTVDCLLRSEPVWLEVCFKIIG